jgi:hypothetical protein
MKPLSLEEIILKEEMKERCLAKGLYVDENAKAKFEMLCHLEDFEAQCCELNEENKQLRKTITANEKCRRKMQQSLMSNIEKQKEVIDKLELENKVLKEQMVAMVKPNYTYGVR